MSSRTGYAVAILAVVLAAVTLIALAEYAGDDAGDESAATESTTTEPVVPESVATVTLDEVGCTYEGDETPPAPAFWMDIVNLTSDFAIVEVDRIPADVAADDVEEFFEEAGETVRKGGGFRGVPPGWSLNRRSGLGTGTTTGGMLVGDPQFPEQALFAGQRYVVWCAISEPPTIDMSTPPPKAVFLATTFEASG